MLICLAFQQDPGTLKVALTEDCVNLSWARSTTESYVQSGADYREYVEVKITYPPANGRENNGSTYYYKLTSTYQIYIKSLSNKVENFTLRTVLFGVHIIEFYLAETKIGSPSQFTNRCTFEVTRGMCT